MEGIAGGIIIRQQGRVRYEVLTDNGDVHVLETTAYFMPELPCRLFSPQAHFQSQFRDGKDPRESANLALRRNRGVITWETGSMTTLSFCETTHLPRLRVYRQALDSAKALALKGCVTDEVNQNLTAKQKLLLRFHFRLGHIAFQHVQWLGRQGLLGPEGEVMGSDKVTAPKCAACQFGKQSQTPIPGRRVAFADSGALTKDKLLPGQRIFVDQYESRAPGRTFASKGGSSSLKFVGGTLFYDAASGYISIQHQHSLTAAETIEDSIRTRGASKRCYSQRISHRQRRLQCSNLYVRNNQERSRDPIQRCECASPERSG
jgi:hypothetical protein